MTQPSEHILFITCSSGHGHMVATTNIQAEIVASNPMAALHTLDIINYLYPLKPIIVDLWNASIRQDSLFAHYLPRGSSFYEFFYERFFSHKLAADIQALFDAYPIRTVIDTQPVFTPFLLKQVAQASPEATIYHKILTDLPVNSFHPFFAGIKRRKHFNNVTFLMHGTPPLVKTPSMEAEFWKTHCHIDLKHVQNTWGMPVHPAFKTIPQSIHDLKISIHPKLLAHYGFSSRTQLTVPDNAIVCTLMMGSQGLEAIEDYFDIIQTEYAQKTLDVPHYFFIACSRNETLFGNLKRKSLKKSAQNTNLIILPLEMQPPEDVASLMWRSQTIMLRASGLSCIEQLAMDATAKSAGFDFHPKRFIHSHCKKTLPHDLSVEEKRAFLLNHSVGHEKGNMIYLKEKLGAVLTRPDVIHF